MTRGLVRTLVELVNPGWVRHLAVPPLEAGLRPNSRLDTADAVVNSFEVDDMAPLADGALALSHGREIHLLRDGAVREVLASFDGAVMALGAGPAGLIAAVEGRGLLEVRADGAVVDLCGEAVLRSCVTALCALGDGSIAMTIGSSSHSHAAWNHALVTGERSGSLVLVRDGAVRTLVGDLAWPSGVCAGEPGQLLVSVSHAHRIEKITLASGARQAVLTNLPAYPGRINAHPRGWVVCFPYVRNRQTELLLEERAFVEEMVRTITPDEWMIPRLRNENPYTSALQLGQLRVLGVLKPWAPARSYGLLGVLGHLGRFSTSFHSRVEGSRHGVTSAVPTDAGIVVAVRGSRNVLILKE